MAQQAPQARPVFGIDQVKASEAKAGGYPHAQQDSRDCFQHIAGDDPQGKRPAEGAVEIGQSRVAAAVAADVVVQNIFGYDDGPVEAAAEVGGSGDNDRAENQVCHDIV